MDFVQRRWLGIKSFIPGEVLHNPGAQGEHPEGEASWETPGASSWQGISSLSGLQSRDAEKGEPGICRCGEKSHFQSFPVRD